MREEGERNLPTGILVGLAFWAGLAAGALLGGFISAIVAVALF